MKSELWILSEWLVARDRVCRFQDSLVAHRERTPYAEVDLVFSTQPPLSELTIIEVKTWKGDIWGPHLISRQQIRRLERARAFMESRECKRVRLMLAVVDPFSSNPETVHYFDFPL
jgi:Holliday junction resolvase-like predicted endonuclease